MQIDMQYTHSCYICFQILPPTYHFKNQPTRGEKFSPRDPPATSASRREISRRAFPPVQANLGPPFLKPNSADFRPRFSDGRDRPSNLQALGKFLGGF